MRKLIIASALASFTLAGCTTTDPYTGEEKTSKATTGSIIGAVAGAAVGAAAGDSEGALAGAAAGAAVGGGVGYYMDRQESQLRQKLTGTGVRVERQGDQINLVLPGDVTFASDDANVEQEYVGVLESVAQVVREFDKTAIRVAGYTDATGSDAYNQLLSEQRAQSVKNVLVNQNVEPGRVQAIGYGEAQPVAPNETAEGRQQNRRVELKLIPREEQISLE